MTNYRNDRTKVLESDANPNVKRWRRLATDPRFVKKAGATLLEGAHLAECYFQTGLPVTNLLVAQSANAEARHWVETYERERGLRPRVVADRLWQTLSPVEHGVGIMLEVPVPKTEDVDFSREDVLYLDGVQDAGNVGTLIRTAVAAGFRTIAASPKTAGFYAPKVMRAGMGAHFGAKLIENCPIDLFAERYEGTILAADARGGEDLFAADDYASGPVCWILGAEGPGVSSEALAKTQRRFYIPIEEACESLNVGAAAAVCLFDVRRRRLARR